MSLYGYGLAKYVVESSLGVPTGCAGKLRWQTTGMFGEAAMAEPRDGVGKATMAGTHKPQGGGWLLGGCDAHAGSETSVGTLHAR
jgi:hypothetical protein